MKLLPIECCDECYDFKGDYLQETGGICRSEKVDRQEEDRIINEDTDIPRWCPLQEFKA